LEEVRLNVSCQRERGSDCSAPVAAAEWIGIQDLGETADSLVNNGSEGVAGSISGMSTSQPALEPHKVYGLSDMLQKFYLEPVGKLAEIPFLGLSWCQLTN
jgi:hypothetical protein